MEEPSKNQPIKFTHLAMIAFELLCDIGIPLVIFAFLGKAAAERYDNKLYLIGAILIAFFITTFLIYRKINKLSKELNK